METKNTDYKHRMNVEIMFQLAWDINLNGNRELFLIVNPRFSFQLAWDINLNGNAWLEKEGFGNALTFQLAWDINLNGNQF
jgi:hypothetical protein